MFPATADSIYRANEVLETRDGREVDCTAQEGERTEQGKTMGIEMKMRYVRPCPKAKPSPKVQPPPRANPFGHDSGFMREWIAARNGKKNLYWMLNPTRKRMKRKPTKADVARFDFAHVECDPLPGETSADAKRRHRAKLKGMKMPPSLSQNKG